MNALPGDAWAVVTSGSADLATARLGVPVAGCMAVEDAPAGIESAKAAGMRVIGVATTHSPEGLLHSTTVVERLSALSIISQDGDGWRLAIGFE